MFLAHGFAAHLDAMGIMDLLYLWSFNAG